MQPVSPYSFSDPVGHCQVGTVWSAVDELGLPLTVAVLDAAVARDQRWRDAFAATVDALRQPGPDRPQYVRAEVSAAVPWAAFAGEAGAGAGAERVFEVLGMQVVAAAGTDAANPTSAPPDPVSGLPVSGQPVSGQPVSGLPVSGLPTSPAGEPYSPAAPTSYGPVYSAQSTDDPFPMDDPFSSPVRHIIPSEPRRSRTGLRIGLAVLVLALLAGGGVFALTGLDGGKPGSAGTPQAGNSLRPEPLPTAPPASPGVEPPRSGGWPAKWPRLTATDSVRTLHLDGLGFPVKVPPTWQCTLAGRAEGFVKYNCGTPPGEPSQFGGEITVRDCAKPCAVEQQTEMRQAEEAWGAQWIRSGQYSTYAEAILQVDGEQRHGLVVVAYWRGGLDGEIDHQLVFRMTAPVKEAQQLRRVATYLRDTLVF